MQFEVGQIKLWGIMYLLVTGSFRWVQVSVSVQYIKLPEVCIVPEILGQLLVYWLSVRHELVRLVGCLYASFGWTIIEPSFPVKDSYVKSIAAQTHFEQDKPSLAIPGDGDCKTKQNKTKQNKTKTKTKQNKTKQKNLLSPSPLTPSCLIST